MFDRHTRPPEFTRHTARLITTGAALILVLAGLTGLAFTSGLAAQGDAGATPGTPASAALPMTPGAADCTVAPVAYLDLPLLQSPENVFLGSPTPPAGGAPADDRTVAAITDTLRIQIGCVNAGEIPRALALAGPDYVRQIFQDLGNPSESQYAALATPVPHPAGTIVTVTAIDQVTAYPDGSASALVTTRRGTATTVNLVLFAASRQSPTGYVIAWQSRQSMTVATPTP